MQSKKNNLRNNVNRPFKKAPQRNPPTTIMRRTPLFQTIPDVYRVKLTWNGIYQEDIGSFQEQVFGVASPGVRIPKYWTQYLAIYKYAYIEAVHFNIRLTVTKPDPVRAVFAESNSQDVVPTSFTELAETPRAITKILSQNSNSTTVVINRTTRASAIMGHYLEDDEAFWNTLATPPSAPIQPVACLGLDLALLSGGSQMVHMVTITYSVKFFTLNHL